MPRLRVRAERIWTADANTSTARSLVIHDRRIEQLDGGAFDRELDGGPWVGPAFIDAHLHLTLGGLALGETDLTGATSRERFAEAIASSHARLPAGRWLKANGWDQSRWGGELPDASWLSACADRPAIAWRMDQHACVVNEPALRAIAARFDLSTDPAGGRVTRDSHGHPTGLFLEQAAWKWAKACVPEPSIQERREGLRAAAAHLARHGIATVGSMEYSRDLVEAIPFAARSRFASRPRCSIATGRSTGVSPTASSATTCSASSGGRPSSTAPLAAAPRACWSRTPVRPPIPASSWSSPSAGNSPSGCARAFAATSA
jgi:predicted amidohydrolase YtcJ